MNDKLLLGLNTQSVIAGARRVDSKQPSPSILDNPKFVALQDRLGVKNPTSVSFYDLPTSAAFGGGYQQLLLLTGYAGFGDLFGVPVDRPSGRRFVSGGPLGNAILLAMTGATWKWKDHCAAKGAR